MSAAGNVGAFTLTNPFLGPSATVPITAQDSSDGGGALSGLADIFSSVGTAITGVYRAVNPPTTGQLVYNPNTGQYVPAGIPQNVQPGQIVYGPQGYTQVPGTIAGINPSMLLLLGAGILLVVLLKR
jgi:hypothetical protein